MNARSHPATAALTLVALLLAQSTRAEESAPETAPAQEEEPTPLGLRAGMVALGGALGAVGGFSIGAAIAGGAYPLLRREPPIAEGLVVAIGTPIGLTLAGAGVGAALAPMLLGDGPSLAGGAGATGGAAVVGAAAAVPGIWLTWEATKALGAAIDEPSPEGCILSLVGLSAALSVMFGGFCVGATSGAAAGGAGGALIDAPDAPAPAAPAIPAASTAALAY